MTEDVCCGNETLEEADLVRESYRAVSESGGGCEGAGEGDTLLRLGYC